MLKFLILILIGGLAVSVQKLTELSRQNQELTSTNQKQSDEIKNLKDGLSKAHQQEQTEYLAQQTTVEGLKSKLKQEQEALVLAEDRLRIDRNGGAGGREIPALQDKLNEQKSMVQELENSLKAVQSQQKQLDQQGHLTLQQYGQNQKQTDADAKAEINAQQSTLKAMQDQAKDLNRNRNDYNTSIQLKDLQGKISQQKLYVEQLKTQRAQASQEYDSAKIGTSVQTQQQKQDLKRSEQDFQARLSAEKATLSKMQKDVQGGMASKKSLQDELRSAEADYNAKKAAVAETQTQLQVETQKLNALK
jgi:chromosome segregation ATPase